MIEVHELSKRYGALVAVDRVSFTAAAGRIFGLLGPNGAGKTTTIGCLCGLLEPSSGSIRLLGRDLVRDGPAARAGLGIVPQELALYEELSARENLSYWGGAYGLGRAALRRRVPEVLGEVGLRERADEPVARFSGGMKRRLNFACGIVHEPRVLLLDEPSVGVDPQSRVHLLELVRRHAARGASVLYTTHYMEEAESLCDDLAILDRGRIIAQGSVEELRAALGERDVLRLTGKFEPHSAAAALRPLDGVEVLQAEPELLVLAVREASRRLPALFAALAGAGAEARETILTRPSLESLFIKLTGKELRE